MPQLVWIRSSSRSSAGPGRARQVPVTKGGGAERQHVVLEQRHGDQIRIELRAVADPQVDPMPGEVDRIALDPDVEPDQLLLVHEPGAAAPAATCPPARPAR